MAKSLKTIKKIVNAGISKMVKNDEKSSKMTKNVEKGAKSLKTAILHLDREKAKKAGAVANAILDEARAILGPPPDPEEEQKPAESPKVVKTPSNPPPTPPVGPSKEEIERKPDLQRNPDCVERGAKGAVVVISEESGEIAEGRVIPHLDGATVTPDRISVMVKGVRTLRDRSFIFASRARAMAAVAWAQKLLETSQSDVTEKSLGTGAGWAHSGRLVAVYVPGGVDYETPVYTLGYLDTMRDDAGGGGLDAARRTVGVYYPGTDEIDFCVSWDHLRDPRLVLDPLAASIARRHLTALVKAAKGARKVTKKDPLTGETVTLPKAQVVAQISATAVERIMRGERAPSGADAVILPKGTRKVKAA